MFTSPHAYRPTRKDRPLYGTHAPAPAPRQIDTAEAWRRVDRCVVYLTDPRLCPVALPLRAQQGLTTLHSGRPAKRFVADGFTAGGKTVGCLVVPHNRTGDPTILWADGAPIANFRLIGA